MIEEILTNAQYQNLYQKYEEPHRFYHNWNHILSMLDIAREIGINLSVAQYLAILYHDAIYYVGAKNNEEQSIQYMMEELEKSQLSDADVMKAAHIIRLTSNHTKDQNVDAETAFVLDLDLHSMAKHDYVSNMVNIRKEYMNVHYHYGLWIEGRKSFLDKMLKRQKIFYTEHFDESMARYNLNFELSVLDIK